MAALGVEPVQFGDDAPTRHRHALGLVAGREAVMFAAGDGDRLFPVAGQTVAAGRTVTVNYVGVLCKTGKEFDSSWKRNQPFTTALSAGSVIPGWVQGIPGMKVGGRRELIIPANLAYGAKGSPPTIPPNSPLVFVVDALSVS